MWLRGFDFVAIEGGRRKEEPAGKPLGARMNGGRKEEGRTSGETAGRRSKRREEGRRRREAAGKPLGVGTSGERGA